MKIHADHEFPCTPEAWWDVYFDTEFKAGLDRALDLAENRILSERQEGDKVIVHASVVPKRELPASVKRVIKGATTAYKERRVIDRTRSRLDWSCSNELLGKRFRSEGSLQVLPVGKDRCRRVLDGVVEVKVMGVGRLIEKGIASDVEKTYGKQAEFIRRWLREHQ